MLIRSREESTLDMRESKRTKCLNLFHYWKVNIERLGVGAVARPDIHRKK